MVARYIRIRVESCLHRLCGRSQGPQAAAPLRILELTSAPVGVHKRGDAVRGRGAARLYQLQPQATFADPAAVAHEADARGLPLEHTRNDLLALEGPFDPAV